MNDALSPLLLIGIGTSGAAIARGVRRAFGQPIRYVLADTDSSTGQADENFVLLGGDRLSGHGTGGNVVSGRLAAEDSIRLLDGSLEGVRLAVVVTSLGGGTGGGATLECVKSLADHGVSSVVFATTPFTFEGEDRQRNSRGIATMIEENANATFFLPLDKLVGEVDNMTDALHRAVDIVASGVTLFWRLIATPGYIRLDCERIRQVIGGAGRGRFAVVTAQGATRSADAIDALIRSEMLATSSGPVRAALCGILAGDDLLLSEVGKIAEGVRNSFGGQSFDLATVNDEATFSGRVSVVVMLFEMKPTSRNEDGEKLNRKRRIKSLLGSGPVGRGRFSNSEPTIWNGEDLDVPTYVRKNIILET